MDIKVKVDMRKFIKVCEKLPDMVEKEADREVAQFCKDVVRNAKLRVPVDTGRLKWSIRQHKDKMGHSIEAGADYASYVEYGTSKMRAQPYIRPAINVYLPRLKKALENILTGKKL